MQVRRVCALFLVLLFLSGCGKSEPISEFWETASAPKSTGEVWHGDVSFDSLSAAPWSMADFQPYADAISAFASEGGSQADFNAADDAIYGALCEIYTQSNLNQLACSRDVTDTAAQEESGTIAQLCYDAMTAYNDAMYQVAVSPHADLLTDHYADWQIQSFAESSTAGDWPLQSRENQLLQQYHALIAQDPVHYDDVLSLFVELVQVRQEMAAAAGYDDYASYAYDSYARDYTPKEAQSIWQSVQSEICPILAQYAAEVYDRSNPLYGSAQIDCSPEKILSAMELVLPSLSADLETAYQYMLDYRLYDIAPSEKKEDIGYTTELYSCGEPYIFNAPSGDFYDYTDFFHEFGHFANSFYNSTDLIFGVADMDLSELQSQGMEVQFLRHYEELFGPENGEIVRDDVLMSLLCSAADGAMYDEFQQRVYAADNLNEEKVRAIYAEVYHAYGNSEYDGWETDWIYIVHNFDYPFYYISYAVSAIPALELYFMEEGASLSAYLQLEAMDTEAWYLSESLEEVGLPGAFDEAAVASVAESAQRDFAS